MQRRQFLKDVTLSSVGVTLLPGIFSGNSFISYYLIPEKIADALSAVKSNTLLLDTALVSEFEKAVMPWKQVGYESGNPYTLQMSDSICMICPVHLSVPGQEQPLHSGALFFRKESNNPWMYVTGLNQYQCEALYFWIDYLKSSGTSVNTIRQLVFPVLSRKNEKVGLIATEKGILHIESRVSNKEVSIQVNCKKDGELVYRNKFNAGTKLSDRTIS
jgi:hypothetical protein